MKRFIYSAFCLCAIVVAAASCPSKTNTDLVGIWEQVIEQGNVKVVTTYDFKNDGKVHQSLVMKSESPVISIKGDGDFDYTYKDNVITFKFSGDDIHFSEFEMEGVPDELVRMSMEQMKLSLVNEEQKLTDVMICGNKLTANSQGFEITMTRQ